MLSIIKISNVKWIGDYAFSGGSSLDSITISSSVKEIGNASFFPSRHDQLGKTTPLKIVCSIFGCACKIIPTKMRRQRLGPGAQ